MIIYQAIDSAEVIKRFHNATNGLIKLNVLISYVYLPGNALKITKTYRHMIDNLCLDSGAYSVFTRKADISVTEYLAYIKRYGDLFNTVFTLDDKFDEPEHNLRNQNFLEQGLEGKNWKPVPCIHDAVDPLGEIQTYIDQGHDYIALGSLGVRQKIDASVLDPLKKKFPHVRFHLFGSLNRETLFKYRPYSADASSWAAQSAKSNIYYWDDIDQREYEIDLESRITHDKKSAGKITLYRDFHHQDQLNEFLWNTFQYRYEDLLNTAIPRQMVNLHYLHQLQERINSTPES
jgi:hypothetical protein